MNNIACLIRPPFVWLLAGLFSTSLVQASEGLTLKKKITTSGMMGQAGKASTTTSYFSENVFRTTSDGDDLIVRLDERTIAFIDHKNQRYSEVSLDELEQIIGQATARLEENQEAMAAMRQLMGGAEKGEVSVTPQGDGENIAGYTTRKYLVKVPPMVEMEIWSAPELTLPPAYYDVLKLRTPPNPIFDLEKMVDAMKEVEGVSLKTVTTVSVMGMKMTSTEEVIEIEKGPLRDSIFQVPSEYSKQPFEIQ